MHSATKFLGGHADALGGIVCGAKRWCVKSITIEKLMGLHLIRGRPIYYFEG
ncbi:hypothetical protein NBRC111894_3716 [Sporolactobacillus inulinus]|uniref:Cystathionine gamma-synthase n=1 Tax=Sporolactobacillus inulinus TaxID=2078 RepID=A0A4Y1ZG64_9BACL|nr:hypothetical protein NBRC111894_3716 [Sporolactobacillus inulinus]